MATKKFEPFQPFQQSPERAFAVSKGRPDTKSALIFVDTNILLTPYRGSSATLAAIKKTFGALKRQNRLVIPAQVAREFARLRPRLVAELHKQMRAARALAVNGRLSHH